MTSRLGFLVRGFLLIATGALPLTCIGSPTKFTDKNGRSFAGSFIQVVNDGGVRKAKIRRMNDDRIFLVPLMVLAKESLEYVERKSATLITSLEIRRKEVANLPKHPPWLMRGMNWLCTNQHKDGTWGLAGTSVMNSRTGRVTSGRRYSASSGDAGTTAVAVMALTNYLSTGKSLAAQLALDKAVNKLLDWVNQ